jgi:hypothetical protein
MALSAFCATCQRTVYIEKDETAVCPVCSAPLLETVQATPEPVDDDLSAPQAEGSK